MKTPTTRHNIKNRSVKELFATALTLVVFMLLSITSTAANAEGAGLFVEPAITYERGETKVNYPSPLSDSTGSSNGLGIGARLGFHIMEIVFLGVDGRYSMPQFKDSAVAYDATSTATNWGPVVGVQTPIVGLRVWGSYILGGELNPNASSGTDLKFDKAHGYRVGAGFRVAIVSVNLEYQNLKYDQVTLEQLGPFNPGERLSGVNMTASSWIASVSMPFEL